MGQHLVLTVHFHGDALGTARFHGVAQGTPEWPPAPGRVFQALVAGVARGNSLPEAFVPALEWLESLPPPIVCTPLRQLSNRVSIFVPNNDADTLTDPSDPKQLSDIRASKKVMQPSLFPHEDPLLYAWPISTDADHARTIVAAATELYQLGRGVDVAWATGDVLEAEALEARLNTYRGIVYRPEPGVRGDKALACAVYGSLASLLQRHHTARLRFEGDGPKARLLFTNPPKPRFLTVSYERTRTSLMFELRARQDDKPWPWALRRTAALVEKLRDAAAARLHGGLPSHAHQIDSTLLGRRSSDGSTEPIAHRTQIVPLPSIGFEHADRAIRRFLVNVPSGAPLSAADIEWAFSGLDWTDPETGELSSVVVTKTDDHDMLKHYSFASRHFRSVTAVALPESAKRRRIEPSRQREETKTAQERLAEENRAVASVHTALRQAGVRGTAVRVQVQREPFDAKGSRAELFAEDTRFAKECLWHVEIELDRAVPGPLVIGDGRFLGLGIMAPVAAASAKTSSSKPVDSVAAVRKPVLIPPNTDGFITLEVLGVREVTVTNREPIALARALRRALMARAQEVLGSASLPRYFSGHERDGSKAYSEEPDHLAIQWDEPRNRFLLIPPHLLERRAVTWRERRDLEILERAVEELVELRAGSAGRFRLQRGSVSLDDVMLRASRSWTSLTPYAVTRHLKRVGVEAAIVEDVRVECERRRLPRPEVTVLAARGVTGKGLEGEVRMEFAVAVGGPVVLGRSRYLGGGLFLPCVRRDEPTHERATTISPPAPRHYSKPIGSNNY